MDIISTQYYVEGVGLVTYRDYTRYKKKAFADFGSYTETMKYNSDKTICRYTLKLEL